MTAIVRTAGNPDTHVVLRGGRTPNYDAVSIDECCRILRKAGLEPRVMVDCSHAQTSKDYRKQPEVFGALCEQVRAGSRAIMGVMLESFINAGKVRVTIHVDPNAQLGPRRIMIQNDSGGSATQTKLGMFSVYDQLDNAIFNAVPRRTWELFDN